MPRLFAEYTESNKKLHLVIENVSNVEIEPPNSLVIRNPGSTTNNNCEIKFQFKPLKFEHKKTLTPDQCGQDTSLWAFSVSPVALISPPQHPNPFDFKNFIQKELSSADSLHCSFCKQLLVSIENIEKVLDLPSLSVLDAFDGLYCHSHGDQDHDHSATTAEATAAATVHSNGVDILLSPKLFPLSAGKIAATVKVNDLDVISCANCRHVLGKRVYLQNDLEHAVLLAPQTVVNKPLIDVDGEVVGHQMDALVPFLKMKHFFAQFLSQLSADKSYRLMLHCAEADKFTDFALLWFMDQRSVVFSSDEKTTSSPSQQSVTTVSAQLEWKVLYRLSDANNVSAAKETDQQQQQNLFSQWNKDLSVAKVTWPSKLCLLFADALVMSTQMRPSHLRVAQQGFIIGSIACDHAE